MEFQPRTEQELAAEKLWAKDVYPFVVVDALEKVSKSSGKPMIELKLKLTARNGACRTIFDYLVEAKGDKLRHAAETCGLLDRYKSGSIADRDFLTRTGKLKLGVEKDKSKTYPDKNIVVDYIPETTGSEKRTA